ncbi:MAG: tRNA pseudouridine(38-40) synthase TruA [Halieaceae bacterium]|nr:tRNA pseudouridine(38-40) synthase TruA [Halieaceae bacterium]
MVTPGNRQRPESCYFGLRGRKSLRLSAQPIAAGTRVAARIEYHGGHYHGWQAQPNHSVPTIQESLEQALALVAGVPVITTCAGRTDTGVHGFSQIVHFDDPVGRSIKAWVMGVNRHLPETIRVHWALPTSSVFHARFSAIARHYRYILCNTPIEPAALHGLVTWYRHSLDLAKMNDAARRLVGEHDFSAFRAASFQANSPHRFVSDCHVHRRGDLVIVDITANGFLHHMVRNIVGSLLVVGTATRSVEWFDQILASRDRTLAAETAPPDGLYLARVDYPKSFGLPQTPEGPAVVSGRL